MRRLVLRLAFVGPKARRKLQGCSQSRVLGSPQRRMFRAEIPGPSRGLSSRHLKGPSFTLEAKEAWLRLNCNMKIPTGIWLRTRNFSIVLDSVWKKNTDLQQSWHGINNPREM